MIVPQNRLLFWFALVVLPFALLAAIEPAALLLALACIAGLVLVALGDAVGAGRSLHGIGVELPPVVRLSKDREAKIELRLRNQLQKQKRLRVALALPAEVTSPQEDLPV